MKNRTGQAGTVDGKQARQNSTITGYDQKEGRNQDKKRSKSRRERSKKDKPTILTAAQADLLKKRPHTVQGQRDAEADKLENRERPPTAQNLRDAVLMALLIDHGMRISEVVLLKFGDIDSAFELIEFERPTADGTPAGIGRHKLTADARHALMAWKSFLGAKAAADSPVIWSTGKGGILTRAGMTAIATSTRIRLLGVVLGLYREKNVATKGGQRKIRQIGTLSAHDCRHYAAITMAERGVPARELMHFFGWASAETAMRYVELTAVKRKE